MDKGGGRGGGPMVVDGSQPGEAVRNGQGAGAQFLRRCDVAPAEDPRPEPDGASMAALVAFELEMAGAGPCRGCRLLLADSALTTLCLLWPWVAGIASYESSTHFYINLKDDHGHALCTYPRSCKSKDTQ